MNRALLLVTLVALGVLCFGVWRILDQPVHQFTVQGDLSTAEQLALTQALENHAFSGVLSTSLADVKAVVAKMEWTRDISVRRSWPDGFEVLLTKQKPLARWAQDHYVVASGELLQMPDAYPGLPHFAVELSTPREAMEIYRLLSQVTARAELSISRLIENQQGEWSITFSNGLELMLGDQNLSDRAYRFVTVYRRALVEHAHEAVYADARYTNGVAVRFAQDDVEVIAELGVDGPIMAAVQSGTASAAQNHSHNQPQKVRD